MKTNRAFRVGLLAAAGALMGYSAWPQTNVRKVEVTADAMKHNDATGIGSGKNFVILDGETTVKGEDGKWNQKTKVAEATGNLSMSDPQADATSKKAIIHYAGGKRIVEMVDDVHITVRPKKKAASGPTPANPQNGDEESPRSHPAVITCERVEYHYARDKKYAKLTGSFKV